MTKVEFSLALSSRGRSILSMSVEELLISLSTELLNSKTILTPGRYSVSLGKMWVSSGEGRTEITGTLSFQIDRPSTDKQRAVARVFS